MEFPEDGLVNKIELHTRKGLRIPYLDGSNGVLDIIAMDFQTFDDIGNDRRKKCINVYSPDQDNRDLCLVSVNIIEGRGGEDHRVGRSSMLGSEVTRDSLVE